MLLPKRLRFYAFALAIALFLALFINRPPTTNAATLDWPLLNGQFFTQTGGYAIIDDGIPMWSEFQRLGGIDAVGYPASQRFEMSGFVVQTMQRVIFQWNPKDNQVYFVNTFDLLSQAGKDDWLLNSRATPKPLPPSFDGGKPWEQVVEARLALLDENPAIKAKYYSVVGDPVTMNGLPTSRVTDMGNNYALRAQRVVFQQWKVNVPWANAGDVTVALGGDIAKEAGLVPAAAAKTQVQEPPLLAAINAYRIAAGLTPATGVPSLMKAAQSHVDYYDWNRGDPSLSGMGLHSERSGAAGFTGASFGDRARAAGYSGGTVTENAGFGDPYAAVDWFMNTVNHRLPLIHPNAIDMGVATSGQSGFTIIDVGMNRTMPKTPLPAIYPTDGSVGVPTAWNGGETPDPAPGLPRPVGYPITVAFSVTQRVEWKNLALYDSAGQSLPVSLYYKDWMRAAAIIPHRPLQPVQAYRVVIDAIVDGKALHKESAFTT